MLVSKATGVTTGSEIAEIVVVVGKVQMTEINVTEFVVVADKRRFVMVVEVVPGYSDPVRCTDHVEETVL